MIGTGGGSRTGEALPKPLRLDAIDAWYESDAYQALIPNRDEAAYVTIVVLDSF